MPVPPRKGEHPLAFALAQLRHAYAHLIAERVTKQQTFADGMIAPVIRSLEQFIREPVDEAPNGEKWRCIRCHTWLRRREDKCNCVHPGAMEEIE